MTAVCGSVPVCTHSRENFDGSMFASHHVQKFAFG